MKFQAPIFCGSSCAQTTLLTLGYFANSAFQRFLMQRVDLLDSNERGISDILLGPEVEQIVVHFARAKDDALDRLRIRNRRVADDLLETTGCEVFEFRGRSVETQHRFRRHENERLLEIALHLPAHDVEVLRRRREIRDLHILLGAKLEESFEACARMLGALAFVPVREQKHDSTGALPLRLALAMN
jgi:hypothetical protein